MSEKVAAREVLDRARSQLTAPLTELQSVAYPEASSQKATEFLADAVSALYEAGAHLDHDEHATPCIRRATEALGQALALVESRVSSQPELNGVSESIARALALLYPVAQSRVRQRRAVMLGEAGQDAPLAFVPKAPEPAKVRAPSVPAPKSRENRENRRGTPRAMLEVDIGLLSHSHFYTGLSMDVSRGGLFVATYEPLPVGTLITLFFVLPSGGAVEAPGTVRWVRAGSPDSPPGMGVAFETLSTEARQAVAAFCEQRSPFYHDSADD